MTLRRLAWVSGVCLTALAVQPATASLVQPGSVIEAAPSVARPAHADTDTDMIFYSRALMPGSAGEALCADRALCQDGNDLSAERLLSAFAPPTQLFARPTLLANAALLTLGLLWVMLTRRTLRVARSRRG